MNRLKWYDGAVFAAVDAWIALRHWRIVAEYRRKRPDRPRFARPPNLSQLVQWRKIFDRNPLFVTFCDKLAARQWALARDPGLAVSEIVWTGTVPAELPQSCNAPGHVIKARHGSGFNYFPNRRPAKRRQLKQRLARWMGEDFGTRHGEWAYSKAPRGLMVETLIGEGNGLWEMTFRCHDGEISAYYVTRDQKTKQEWGAFFAGDGTRLPSVVPPADAVDFPPDFEPPPILAEAREHARRLSRGLDYVRVDLICHDGRVYFCEMTVYVGSGYGIEERAHIAPYIERAWLGTIGLSWFLSTPQPWPLSLYAAAFRRWVAVRQAELGASPS